jgi:hypothetical protein
MHIADSDVVLHVHGSRARATGEDTHVCNTEPQAGTAFAPVPDSDTTSGQALE